MLYQVTYTVRDREDEADETEHDIQADSPLDALCWWISWETGAERTQKIVDSPIMPWEPIAPLDEDTATIHDYCAAYFTPPGPGRFELCFDPGDGRLIEVNGVDLEDSAQCDYCRGTGRVTLVEAARA